MLEGCIYQATFVLNELQKKYPDVFPDLTLQSL
jgi:hypothetical protein